MASWVWFVCKLLCRALTPPVAHKRATPSSPPPARLIVHNHHFSAVCWTELMLRRRDPAWITGHKQQAVGRKIVDRTSGKGRMSRDRRYSMQTSVQIQSQPETRVSSDLARSDNAALEPNPHIKP